jgi:hypothetical protein
VNRKTGKRSFELTWDLFESEDHYGVGSSNGFQWICLECYDRFWDRPGFVSGAYGDIT